MKTNIRLPIVVVLLLAGIFGVASGAFAAAGSPKGKKRGPGANADVSGVKPMREPDKSMVFKKTPQGFFNRQPWHDATLRKADEFLTALGYLKGEPQIKAPAEAVLKRE